MIQSFLINPTLSGGGLAHCQPSWVTQNAIPEEPPPPHTDKVGLSCYR